MSIGAYVVGGLEHLDFSKIYGIRNPSHWLSYLSRWLKPPTSYYICVLPANFMFTNCYAPYMPETTPVFFTPWASPDPNIPEPSTHHSPFAPRRGDQKDRLKRWLALREKSPKCCGRWADVLHGGSHVDICETRPYQQPPWSHIYLSTYLSICLSVYLSNLI